MFQFNVRGLQDAHSLSQAAAAAAAASSAAAAASSGVSMGVAALGLDVSAAASVSAGHSTITSVAAHSAVQAHPLYLQGGSAHSSGGSVSSTGGGSPTSPLRAGKEEDCSLHGRSSTEGKSWYLTNRINVYKHFENEGKHW